MQYLCIFFHIG